MFSVGHLIIIFIVALVVFGPEKLPELARNFGKVVAEFKRATGDLRSTFEDHLKELEREADQRRIAPAITIASVPPPEGSYSVTALPEKPSDGGPAAPIPDPIPGVVPARAPYERPEEPAEPAETEDDYGDANSNILKPSAPRPTGEKLDLNVEDAVPATEESLPPEENHSDESPKETVTSDGGPRPD